MSDEAPKRTYSTLPPPDDAEDLYGASTVVGLASAELLALVRGDEGDDSDEKKAEKTTAPPPPLLSNADAELTAVKQTAARSAKVAVTPSSYSSPPSSTRSRAPAFASLAHAGIPTTTPGAVEAWAPPAAASAPTPAVSAPPAAAVARTASASAPATTAAPADGLVRLHSQPRPLEKTSRRPAARTPDEPRPGKGMPPALAIALVFAAVALTLAALVR